MTIRFPAQPVSGMPYRPPEPEIPGERSSAVRWESEQDYRMRMAALAREVAYSQQVSGTNVVSYRPTNWGPEDRQVPGHTVEPQQQRGSDLIDWGRVDGAPEVPMEIVVERVPSTEEVEQARLNAELEAMRRHLPGRW